MIRHRTPRKARAVIEALEARQLLSGNVTATLAKGTLTIQGDGGDNVIQIESTTNIGGNPTITVANVNNPTSINGHASADFAASAVNNLRINMQNGNDQVYVFVGLPNTVTISVGSGNDTVGFGPSSGVGGGNQVLTANSLSITASSKSATSDSIYVTNSTINALSISTGSGNDIVRIGIDNTGSANGVCTIGSLAIDSGNGNSKLVTPSNQEAGDTVVVFNSTITGSSTINTGSGDDFVELFDSSFGSLTINTHDAGLTAANTSGDEIYASSIAVTGAVNITTGAGNDNVYVANLTSTKFNVSTGNGYDVIELQDVTATSGTLDGGGKNDVFKDDGGNSTFELVSIEGVV